MLDDASLPPWCCSIKPSIHAAGVETLVALAWPWQERGKGEVRTSLNAYSTEREVISIDFSRSYRSNGQNFNTPSGIEFELTKAGVVWSSQADPHTVRHARLPSTFRETARSTLSESDSSYCGSNVSVTGTEGISIYPAESELRQTRTEAQNLVALLNQIHSTTVCHTRPLSFLKERDSPGDSRGLAFSSLVNPKILPPQR